MLLLPSVPELIDKPMSRSGSKLLTPPKNRTKRTWADANYGVGESPWRRAGDSPSMQLLRELDLQRSAAEHELQLQLDREMSEREREHTLQLRIAAEEHERVYERAERARERARLEFEQRRREQEEEEVRELERQRREHVNQEIATRERRAAEALHLEQRQRAAIEAQRTAEEQAKEGERRRREEGQRRAELARQEEEASKRQAEEEAKQSQKTEAENCQRAETEQRKRASLAEPKNSLNGLSSGHQSQRQEERSGITTSISQRDAEHQRYLDIHQRLKQMRKAVVEQCKSNKQLKTQLGDWRREIRKVVGQLTLTENKSVTQTHVRKIRDTLTSAAKIQQPTLDLSQYIPPNTPPTASANPTTTQFPAVLLYELNIFAKRLIAQFSDECSAVTKLAEPIGILAITIFAAPELQSQSQAKTPLIDIVLAKLHFACPILFGIAGDQRTNPGRARLGWPRDKDASALQRKPVWAPDQKHYDRVTGLAAGFAALSLRDFTRSNTVNPLPAENYWMALARIINTPAAQVTQTHLVALKALVENHADKFRKFYGDAAVAVLRRGVVEFAGAAPEGPGKSAIKPLPMLLERDFGLRL